MLKTSAFVVSTKTWGEPTDSDLFHWDDEFEETIRECGKRNTKRGRSSGGISFCSRKSQNMIMKFCHRILTESC